MNDKEQNKYRFIVSKITDPYLNQALDESLFNSVLQKKSDFILRFWKADTCVVIGRNQSLNAEVNVKFCQDNHIPIIRRITGGGTIFLDLGSLNFSFIFNDNLFFYTKNVYILNKSIIKMIIEALNTLSFNCEFQPPNSIFLDGKKVSGNAQIFKKSSILHHGTLLYHSNLELLDSIIKSQVLNQNTKFIRSNKVKTTNLFFFNSKISEEDIILQIKYIIENKTNLNLNIDDFTKEELQFANILKFKRYYNLNWLTRF